MSKFVISVSKWKQVTEEEAFGDDWDMIPTLNRGISLVLSRMLKA